MDNLKETMREFCFDNTNEATGNDKWLIKAPTLIGKFLKVKPRKLSDMPQPSPIFGELPLRAIPSELTGKSFTNVTEIQFEQFYARTIMNLHSDLMYGGVNVKEFIQTAIELRNSLKIEFNLAGSHERERIHNAGLIAKMLYSGFFAFMQQSSEYPQDKNDEMCNNIVKHARNRMIEYVDYLLNNGQHVFYANCDTIMVHNLKIENHEPLGYVIWNEHHDRITFIKRHSYISGGKPHWVFDSPNAVSANLSRKVANMIKSL